MKNVINWNMDNEATTRNHRFYLSKTATRGGDKKYWELTVVKHDEFSGRIWPTGHSTLKAAKLWVARNYNHTAEFNGFFDFRPYDCKRD